MTTATNPTPANPLPANPLLANPLLERHAPLWRRLREWVREALCHHTHSLEFRPREQVQPLRRWIALIEQVLRRLILLAATAEKVDVTPQWSPAPKEHPGPQPEDPQEHPPETPNPPPAPRKANAAATGFRFRLYGVNWPREARAAPIATASSVAALAAASPHIITIRIALAPDSLLNTGGRPKRPRRARRTPRAHRAASRCTPASKTPPELTTEQFDAWLAAQPPIDREALNRAWLLEQQRDADRANRAWRAEYEALTRGDDPSTDVSAEGARAAKASAPASETPPDLVSTQHYVARLAFLEQIAENPQPLIRRAARALARRYEIALRLAKAAAPKATRLLAGSPHLYGALIPLHAAFTVGMEYFAVSYTEPDTS